MAPTDDAPQPAPAGGGPPANRGNGPTAAPGSEGDPEPNDRGLAFDHYQLLEKIGQSEFAVVYKARCMKLDRIVAIQILRVPAMGAQVEQLFARMRHVARLRHPNILAIYDVGEHQGHPYLSMEYVTGPSLAQIGGGKPLPAVRAAEYVMKIARAVDYAHQRGVLHRDLKPSNVTVDEDDQPRVCGFDLASLLRSNDVTTTMAFGLGTPAYLSPEQLRGDARLLGPASDIYALGVILYELLTGRCPFSANSPLEVRRQAMQTEPPPLRRVDPTVSRDLETICLKCLRKEATRRYPTAGGLAEDLHRFLNQEPILARPAGPIEKARHWLRRQRSTSTSRQRREGF